MPYDLGERSAPPISALENNKRTFIYLIPPSSLVKYILINILSDIFPSVFFRLHPIFSETSRLNLRLTENLDKQSMN